MRTVRKMMLACAAVFACLLLSSFSRAGGAKDVVSGCIAHYGNEPFTYIALKADDGEVYRIRADAELDRELRTLDGARIELHGTVGISEADGRKCIQAAAFRRMDSR
ncbi:MAG: hypothetical protein K2H09_09125 [Treponemataceae bacterium]|nr:hypothetical protein [Treponemataceae bacterium]